MKLLIMQSSPVSHHFLPLSSKCYPQHSEDLSIDRTGRCELDVSGSGQGLLMGCCEHGNETSCSIKCGNFLISRVTVRLSRRSKLKLLLVKEFRSYS
jgi:hypothetical protein